MSKSRPPNQRKRTARCLIEWQLHTRTRPAEAATARWADIDLERKIWTIPPERMKKRRTYIIPLTQQALELLEAIKPFSGYREYSFPADRNTRTHCNSQTANMALKRMRFAGRLVSHGMRSMTSTILNEHGCDPELIEVALAHIDKDEVRSTYNRADYIERRRPMMKWWSDTSRDRLPGVFRCQQSLVWGIQRSLRLTVPIVILTSKRTQAVPSSQCKAMPHSHQS